MDPSLKSALNTLPPPDADADNLSRQLTALIVREMTENNGRITFDRYMELALYQPGLGYYSNGLRKFGEQGDFITAPELTPLFGRCLARQCAEALEQIEGGSILEFGAGSGRLAADILVELADQDQLPQHYCILELSADLRLRQQELLQREQPEFFPRIEWLDQLPDNFRAVIVANEVLDAMPVSRFSIDETGTGVREQFIQWNGESFLPVWDSVSSPGLLDAVNLLIKDYTLPPGYESEINLRAKPWITELGAMLTEGMALLIDYGYNGREYYHPQRDTGTLICHYRHRVHSDPFILPGLQDITANVDFTAVAGAGLDAGFDSHAFTTQTYFLLAGGLEQLMAKSAAAKEQLRQIQAVKQLTMPNEMGERFKVLSLGKGLEQAPSGFSLHRLPLT